MLRRRWLCADGQGGAAAGPRTAADAGAASGREVRSPRRSAAATSCRLRRIPASGMRELAQEVLTEHLRLITKFGPYLTFTLTLVLSLHLCRAQAHGRPGAPPAYLPAEAPPKWNSQRR